MSGKRDTPHIIQFHLDVNPWLAHGPSVEEARPCQCPRCGVASRPPGGALRIWGHGLRLRQLRGPPLPGADPETRVIAARRYRCLSCEAILLVVPRGVVRCKHFAATAIAFAVALFGIDKLPQHAVREAVNPWRVVSAPRTSWASLRRWINAIGSGALWPALPRAPSPSSSRQIAERAAMALSAWAPSSLASTPLSHLAFHGGAHMA